jgi:predicted hydrocarbon binding protein
VGETTEPLYRDFYSAGSYMTADIETGVLYNRMGRRMLGLTDDFITGLLKAISGECGEEASRVEYRCGHRWGVVFGNGLLSDWGRFFDQDTSEFSVQLLRTLLLKEFAHNGWGMLDIDLDRLYDGILPLRLENSAFREVKRNEMGITDDTLTAGILGGMMSSLLTTDLDCLQLEGTDSDSRFLVISSDRLRAWDLKPYDRSADFTPLLSGLDLAPLDPTSTSTS